MYLLIIQYQQQPQQQPWSAAGAVASVAAVSLHFINLYACRAAIKEHKETSKNAWIKEAFLQLCPFTFSYLLPQLLGLHMAHSGLKLIIRIRREFRCGRIDKRPCIACPECMCEWMNWGFGWGTMQKSLPALLLRQEMEEDSAASAEKRLIEKSDC